MISFERLFKLMKEKGESTYTLMHKHHPYRMDSRTLGRLRRGEGVTTHTINILCKILDCRVEDIMEYIPDKPTEDNEGGDYQ